MWERIWTGKADDFAYWLNTYFGARFVNFRTFYVASLVKTLFSRFITNFLVLVFMQPAFSFSTDSIVANQMFSTGYYKSLQTLQFLNNFLPTRNFPMHSAKTKFSPQVWFYHWLRDLLQHTPINVLTTSQIYQINCVVLSKIFNAKLCLQGAICWSREELFWPHGLAHIFFKVHVFQEGLKIEILS